MIRRWSVVFEPRALKDLRGLGAVERRRVLGFLHDRIHTLPSPRALGEALSGPLAGLWKYRVGDIRIIARISDDELLILVVTIGNRGGITDNPPAARLRCDHLHFRPYRSNVRWTVPLSAVSALVA